MVSKAASRVRAASAFRNNLTTTAVTTARVPSDPTMTPHRS